MRSHLFLLLSLAAISSCLFISLSQAELCHPQDKRALLQIKKSFGDPYMLSSWTKTSDCCHDWFTIECDPTTNRVVTLAIVKGQISGVIPPEVGDLPYLTELIFHKLSNVTGPIQPAIAKLKNLESLTLDWLNLTGPIPPFLGKLKNLSYINLAYNKLSGSIPSELGSLRNLGLFLSRNNLTGSIPSSLAYAFQQFIPLNPPAYVDLSHNQLTGRIPASFNYINFTSIDLSRNKLEGDVSMLFGQNKTIESVDLNRNQLEFNLSELVFGSRFTFLDIDHNMVYGSIPSRLTELPMQGLNVSYNRLCGQIPVGGQLQSFDIYNYLHNKCLCGAPLPACK